MNKCHIIQNFYRFKSEGLLVALTGTLDDDNAWIINNVASRHMIRESGQLHTL